ncbi:MAG TPA: ABC transporter permease [Pseudolysinimonas sp.]|nr:ABC transporter permease [Pseudolysinimonas sp.]
MSRGLPRYIAGRLGQAVLVLWAAYSVAFAVLYLLPGDPLAISLAASGVQADSLSPAQLATARHNLGLDGSPFQQYLTTGWKFLHGDFGSSLASGQPVAGLLAERLPHTLALAGIAVVLSLVGGGLIAYLAAYIQWAPARALLRRLPSLGYSVPSFWIGLLLIQLFAFTLGWLPATGNTGPHNLILPAITLSVASSAVYAQVLIRGFDDVRDEPYIATARAKGLSRGQAQLRHGLRNASLPLITLIPLQIGNTVSASVLVETVFARFGVGRLAQDSVLRQDIPVVLAIVVLSAAAFVVVNLVVDLIYPALDPRIRLAPRLT